MLCLRFPCRPVSRVLYVTIIYLDVISLKRSSRLLRLADHDMPFHDVAPDGVYKADMSPHRR